jgi:hypothetical protein
MNFRQWLEVRKFTPERIEYLDKEIRRLALDELIPTKKIAKQLGVSPNYINKYIRDNFTPEEINYIWAINTQRNIQRERTPEQRAKQSQYIKARWQDPEYQELQRQHAIKRWQDPQYRAQKMQYIQDRWNKTDFWQWLNTFPPEKQKEIIHAINARKPLE